MTPLTLRLEKMQTLVDVLLVVTDERDVVRVVYFDDDEDGLLRVLRRHYGPHGFTLVESPSASAARRALEQYFAGDLTALDSLEVATGGTAFQRTVWAALREIPTGRTVSYGQLARSIGKPDAVRAVGLANGSNPIGIIVPCHRVIGADGSLTGYGGGLWRKKWLLEHEGVKFNEQLLLH